MKVLVLGSGGMAGHVIATYLKENTDFNVSTLSVSHKSHPDTITLDVTGENKLRSFLANNKFDVIINAIGSLIEASSSNKDKAVYLNSYLPHFLEELYKDTRTKIIHLSTDCVFSGKTGPYKENTLHDGSLFYDRTKSLGEIDNKKDLTFRMSIIGPDLKPNGVGLFNWFMKQSGNINGYTNNIWNGITTITLAKAIHEAILQNLSGIYHLVPQKNISKFELLKLLKDTFNKSDIKINPYLSEGLDKTLINTREDFNFIVPTYPVMIDEMKAWIEKHPDYYLHYEKTN